MNRTVFILAMLIVISGALTAQTQFPDVLWERGGNTRPAYDIAPLSKGRLIVGSYDGSVRVWDLATRSSTLTLITSRFLGGRAMGVTPDEEMVVTGDADGWVRCWSIESGRLLFTLGRHNARINDVACSPTGQWVAVGDSAGVVRRWDLDSRTILDTMLLTSPIRSISVSPDGRSMVVTTSLADGKNPDTVPNPARIVSIPGLSVRATIDGVAPGSGGTSPIYEAAYVSSSEIHMVTSNAILTVDGATGAVLDRRSVDYGIAGGPEFLVVEDSARVITAGVLFAGLRRYVKGRSDVDTIIEFGRQVSALAVDRKNRRLFMATQGSDVQIWDLRADTFMFDLEGMTGYLRRAAWTKDGSRIATASTSSDRIRLIDAVDGSVAENVVNPPWGFPTPAAITFDNDATSLYFTPVGDDGVRRLRRFDLRTSTLDDRFTQRASTVVTSRSTSRVIVLSRDSVFALESGNPQPLVASTIDVCSPWVAVSTRDGRIITSCADSTLRILDGLTGQVLSTVPVSSSVVDILVPASSDGNADVLVLLHYGRTQPDAVDAVIVDASTLQEVSSLSAIGTPFIDGFLGNRIACSRSAEFFAVGQDDGAIAIIERSTRLRVKTLETGGSPVTFITVHPEREWMVAGTADGRVLRLKDPWPKSTSSVVDADVLTPEQLRNADVVQWYLLDGRCVGIGADHHLLYPHQPHVVVARFGNRIKTQLILNGAMR